jgi:ATP-dependent Clp protease ATP-binding subunit ClpC
MFNHYAEVAKRTVFFAKYEAGRFSGKEICTEHILIGLLKDTLLVERFLQGLTIDEVSQDLSSRGFRPIEPTTPFDLPLSDDTQSALKFAEKEAESLGSERVGNEHILLGLLRVEESFAARLLQGRGLSADGIRKQIVDFAPGTDA